MIELTLATGKIRSVSDGTVTLPRTGIWMADLVMTDVEIPAGKVTVRLGNVLMPATVARAELVDGAIHLRLMGGNGDLSRTAKAKHYYHPIVKHVLADLLRDSGETLSVTSDTTTLGRGLESWTTLAFPTGTMLAALTRVIGPGINWRILHDGTFWIGPEAWPDSPLEYRSQSADGANAAEVIASDMPALWPGTKLGGRQVDTVIHDLASDRTTVLYVTGSVA